MGAFVSVVVGVTTGVVSGIAAWVLMYRAFAPRLTWESEITKRPRPPEAPERWRYALRFSNAGWRRAVAVTVHVRARLPMPLDKSDERTRNNYIFDIPTDTRYVPLVHPMRTFLRRKRPGTRYAVVLRFADIDETDLAYAPLPDAVKRRVRDGTVELEELMAHGLRLRFWASGYDEATGAMKMRASPWLTEPSQIRVIDSAAATPGAST